MKKFVRVPVYQIRRIVMGYNVVYPRWLVGLHIARRMKKVGGTSAEISYAARIAMGFHECNLALYDKVMSGYYAKCPFLKSRRQKKG